MAHFLRSALIVVALGAVVDGARARYNVSLSAENNASNWGATRSACEYYYKIADGDCADYCLGSYFNFCPRSLITSAGGLTVGACISLNYTTFIEDYSVTAGPCGTIVFKKYTNGTGVQALLDLSSGAVDGTRARYTVNVSVEDNASIRGASRSACEYYYKIADGDCADYCLGSYFSFCPRSLITSAGGLTVGTCHSLNYTTFVEDYSVTAGPCGTIVFKKYTNVSAAQEKE
mmetsp:Transcript_74886/g.201167  ORF Transcript_74886/g.201167 Transcript_74886/m.201167 type:complete len:232 (+) Transcript_74886:82-777(+)